MVDSWHFCTYTVCLMTRGSRGVTTIGPDATHLPAICQNLRAMRQRKLGSHTPPCHRRMVITTSFNVMLAALQRSPVLYHTRWLLTVFWLWSSGH